MIFLSFLCLPVASLSLNRRCLVSLYLPLLGCQSTFFGSREKMYCLYGELLKRTPGKCIKCSLFKNVKWMFLLDLAPSNQRRTRTEIKAICYMCRWVIFKTHNAGMEFYTHDMFHSKLLACISIYVFRTEPFFRNNRTVT